MIATTFDKQERQEAHKQKGCIARRFPQANKKLNKILQTKLKTERNAKKNISTTTSKEKKKQF